MSSTTSPFRQKSKTVGYRSSPQHNLENQLAALQEEEAAAEHSYHHHQHRHNHHDQPNNNIHNNSTTTNHRSTTLRKQYFRHCRTDSEKERENSNRMSKTLQANNNEERWKKHQSLKMDPLERIGTSCASESTNRNNIFSKFISKLSKKKSSNNLF